MSRIRLPEHWRRMDASQRCVITQRNPPFSRPGCLTVRTLSIAINSNICAIYISVLDKCDFFFLRGRDDLESQERRLRRAHARVHARRLRVPGVLAAKVRERRDPLGELQQRRVHTDPQIDGQLYDRSTAQTVRDY